MTRRLQRFVFGLCSSRGCWSKSTDKSSLSELLWLHITMNNMGAHCQEFCFTIMLWTDQDRSTSFAWWMSMWCTRFKPKLFKSSKFAKICGGKNQQFLRPYNLTIIKKSKVWCLPPPRVLIKQNVNRQSDKSSFVFYGKWHCELRVFEQGPEMCF